MIEPRWSEAAPHSEDVERNGACQCCQCSLPPADDNRNEGCGAQRLARSSSKSAAILFEVVTDAGAPK